MMIKTADVVIIGSGIIGNASAYYLAKKGCSVIVLEKSKTIGGGGSSRNGGGVRQSGRDRRELSLIRYAIENLWPSLSDELGVDVEYHKNGNLRLGKTERHLEILRGLAETACNAGVDVRMIDGYEVRQINPYLSDEIIGASWCPTDGHANPLMATLGYYRKAREMGVKFYTDQNVIKIEKHKGKVSAVITETDRFECDNVILAASIDSRKIAETVEIDIPIQPQLIEALVTEAEPPMFNQMLGTAEADFYGHQSNHGSFIFGGSSGLEAFNKDNGSMVTSSITAPCICRGIMKYIPKLKDAKIVRTWAGWMDVCADKVPIISPVSEVPGLVLACGFTGHGFGIAPAVGVQISELITEGKFSLDLHELRYDRFKAKI